MQHGKSEMNIEKRAATKLKIEGETTETLGRNDLWITKKKKQEKKKCVSPTTEEKKNNFILKWFREFGQIASYLHSVDLSVSLFLSVFLIMLYVMLWKIHELMKKKLSSNCMIRMESKSVVAVKADKIVASTELYKE